MFAGMRLDVRGRWQAGHNPLLPSQDPFYRPPVDLAARRPGAILRSRPIDVALFGVVPQKVSAWQLLYRSNDLHGRREAAVTTVLLPPGASPHPDRPLLAFQSAIDAVTERCDPSYVLQRGARARGSVTQAEWLLVAGALRRGWAVSIADHGGRAGNFGAPREPGYRALDGIRAALQFEPLNLHADTAVGVWGYSGGGLASSWLVEMAPTYAPEITIVGAVLGSPVGDPGQVFIRLNGGRYSGFPAIVIAALRPLYPILDQVIEANLAPEGHRLLARAQKLPPITALAQLANQSFDNYLHKPLEEIMAEPELQGMLDDLRLGGSTPRCPLLVVQPVRDKIVHIEGIDAQVDLYRRGGTHVTYLRDRCSDHFTLLPLSTPMSLRWLADRFAGEQLPPADTHTVWSVATMAPGVRGFAELALTALRVVFGRPLAAARGPLRRTDRAAAA
ncbi:lipase family protein [Nocardia sp. NPDC050408]|uniref:lipase family protein n=1 Tax=Nocardia sp. NPDC050408 TaxID=3364319 RepID=UPI003789E3AD